MLKEVELRFQVSKKEKNNILQIFNNHNSKKIFENDLYFCLKQYIVKGKNASEMSPHIFRLRKSTKGSFLAFKCFTKNKTSWTEEECKIDNIGSFEKILKNIDYNIFLSIKKERYFFSHKKISYNLDCVNKLGFFLELETFSNNVSMAKKNILKIAKEKFGINPKNKIDIGYVQLMEKYLLNGEN